MSRCYYEELYVSGFICTSIMLDCLSFGIKVLAFSGVPLVGIEISINPGTYSCLNKIKLETIG